MSSVIAAGGRSLRVFGTDNGTTGLRIACADMDVLVTFSDLAQLEADLSAAALHVRQAMHDTWTGAAS